MTHFLNRQSTFPVQSFFLTRMSSRSFDPNNRLLEEELMALFEAARWAPSSYNNQPWRFIYARRGDAEWNKLFDVLIEFNKSWCKNADTLVAVISRNNFVHNNKPSRTAQFDAGASWMSLAIEAHLRNIITHGMEGFDYDALKKNLDIPDTYTIEALIAIGKQGNVEDLPKELQEREIPTDRKQLGEIVSKGKFVFNP